MPIKPPKRPSLPPKRRTSLRMSVVENPTDPHVSQEGKCPVCGGRVASTSEYEETATGHKMNRTGIHCLNCGIKFQFIPPANLRKQ